jgi:hypothetical protein
LFSSSIGGSGAFSGSTALFDTSTEGYGGGTGFSFTVLLGAEQAIMKVIIALIKKKYFFIIIILIKILTDI